MTGELVTPLRERAMATLQESTVMLKVACNLIEQGNRKEAQRLQDEARVKRRVSVLLMAKANALEKGSGADKRSRYYEVHGFMAN